jgi:hypothetical protein
MLSFDTLWQEHPYIKDGGAPPCTDEYGNPHFENQCAIRMGVALDRAGMELRGFRGARCWFGHRGHTLRAEELANWLRTQSRILSRVAKTKNAVHTQFAGKKGIAFFKDGWPRGGDHIDVWNGERLGGGQLDYFSRAKEVWFWELP